MRVNTLYDKMKITPPAPILAASYLTDSVPVEMDLLEETGIDMKKTSSNEITLFGLFSNCNNNARRNDDTSYLLISQDEIKKVLVRLNKNNQYFIVQEVLDLLNSDIFSDSAAKENKSFRVPPESYLKAVTLAYNHRMSLSNYVKKELRDEILLFIDNVKKNVAGLTVNQNRLEFLNRELDSWVSDVSPRDSYNMGSIDIYPISDEEWEVVEDIGHLLVKYYISEEMRKKLGDESLRTEINKLIEKIFGFVFEYLGVVDTIYELRDLQVYESNNQIYLGINCCLGLSGKWKDVGEFYACFNEFEAGDKLKKAWGEVINFEGFDSYDDNTGGCYVANPRMYNHNFVLDIDEKTGCITLEGVPYGDKDFVKNFASALSKKWEKEIGIGRKDLTELKKEQQECIDKGEWGKAIKLNERLVTLSKLEEYHMFIAKIVSNLASQVISVRGVKNIISFVDSVTYNKNLNDIIEV